MSTKIKILLIEDNPADVGLVTIYMEEAFPNKYSLVKADYLSEGLKHLTTQVFDVVLCDLALPDSYGMETFEKAMAASHGIPIILLTGHGDESFAINAVSQGAADFLNKNQLDSNLLRRAIMYGIERNNLSKQLLIHTKNLEESERKYRTLFEESNDPIYISSYGGRFLDFNKAAAELFGYTREEFAKLSLSDLYYYPEEKNHIKEALRKKGRLTDYEVVLQKKDGTPVICQITASPHKNENDELQSRGIIRDVTAQKKVEELRRAKEVAEQTSLARQEFLSVMSHEIRTPLNTIFFTAHLLQEESPTEKQKEHLDLLQFSANNLLSLINNILDFSKIESGKIKLESINFNFHDLINRITESFSHNVNEKQLKLNVDMENKIPAVLKGDPTRLTQVLNNLLHNAIKFTNEGQVSLHIEKLSGKNNEVELLFEISDTGIGIESERMEEIFDSFTQARPSITRQFGGTGLGLTICKKLVKIMGGDIKVESELGKGSSFFFNLPLQVGAEDKINIPDITRESNSVLKGIKILLTEDNLTNRMLAEKFLKRWGAQVESAGNGEEAIEQLKDKKFDLVLMDIQMPVMDGYEANARIRKMGFTHEDLPVIALTAFAMEGDKIKAYESGMDDYITKPIDPYELYRKVIKNVSHKLAKKDLPQVESEETNEVIHLSSLVESFKDDPAFVNDYLHTFEREFSELPVQAIMLSKLRDSKALAELIHKINPSIRRFENTELLTQLNELRDLTSDKDTKDAELTRVGKKIQHSCDELLESIYAIKSTYV